MSTDALLERLSRAFRGRLGTIRPPHAFVLTGDRLVHVSRPEKGGAVSGVRVRAASLPPGTLREGPSGVPLAGAGLTSAIGSLLVDEESKGVSAASLAVPDEFVRALAVDIEPGTEENASEVEEVLRWKLDRAFGEGAPALRLSWRPAGVSKGGATRILALAVPEEAAASWEAAFAASGIRIGALEPASLAFASLGRLVLGDDGFVVWADGRTVSTLYFEKAALRFLRTKPDDGDPDETLQEIRLMASFVAGGLEEAALDVSGALVAAPASSPVTARLREFRRASGGPDPLPLDAALSRWGLPPTADDPALLVGLGLLAGEA